MALAAPQDNQILPQSPVTAPFTGSEHYAGISLELTWDAREPIPDIRWTVHPPGPDDVNCMQYPPFVLQQYPYLLDDDSSAAYQKGQLTGDPDMLVKDGGKGEMAEVGANESVDPHLSHDSGAVGDMGVVDTGVDEADRHSSTGADSAPGGVNGGINFHISSVATGVLGVSHVSNNRGVAATIEDDDDNQPSEDAAAISTPCGDSDTKGLEDQVNERGTPPPAPDIGQPVSLLTPPSTSSGEGGSPATSLGEESSPYTVGKERSPQPPTGLTSAAYDTAATPFENLPTQASAQGSSATPELPQNLEWKPYVPPQRMRPFVPRSDGGSLFVREQKVPPWRRPARPAYLGFPIYPASSVHYRESFVESNSVLWKPSQELWRGGGGGGAGLRENPHRHPNENYAVGGLLRGRGREQAREGMRNGYGAGAIGRDGGRENGPPGAPALKRPDEGTSRHRTRSRSRGRQPKPVPEPPHMYKSDDDRSSHYPDGHSSSQKHKSGRRERHRSQSSDRYSEESQHDLGRHGPSHKYRSERERSTRERHPSQSCDRYSEEESEHRLERHHGRHRNHSHTREGPHHRGNSHHLDSPRGDSGHRGDPHQRGSSRHRSTSRYGDSHRKKSHHKRGDSHHRSSSHGEDPHHKKSQRHRRSHRHRSHSRHRESSRHHSRDRTHHHRHRSSRHSRHDKASPTKKRHRSPPGDTSPTRKRRKASPTIYTDDEKGGQQEGVNKPRTRPHRQ